MLAKKLKSRLSYIEGTPLKDRAKVKTFSRRDENYVIMNEEDVELEKYDTFFDYEEELADLKPSGEQYVEMISSDPFVIMEDKDEGPIESESSPIIMEEELELPADSGPGESKKKGTYTDVVGFQFVQCDFTKKDGARCKRQAPKDSTICSVHKKYLKKHQANS